MKACWSEDWKSCLRYGLGSVKKSKHCTLSVNCKVWAPNEAITPVLRTDINRLSLGVTCIQIFPQQCIKDWSQLSTHQQEGVQCYGSGALSWAIITGIMGPHSQYMPSLLSIGTLTVGPKNWATLRTSSSGMHNKPNTGCLFPIQELVHIVAVNDSYRHGVHGYHSKTL